ncbi:hypothetical protein B0H13DRAFT_2300043 [Mycena leptocephala]|nr:hypothetical protein B0H13DRAFT_2300043 [Mycena leptocephala]
MGIYCTRLPKAPFSQSDVACSHATIPALLHAYLYTQNPGTLALLTPPQESGLLQLVPHATKVHSLWRNACALGVIAPLLYDVIEESWAKTLTAMRASAMPCYKTYGRPKEVVWMHLINNIAALGGVSTGGNEGRWIRVKGGEIRKRITVNMAHDAELRLQDKFQKMLKSRPNASSREPESESESDASVAIWASVLVDVLGFPFGYFSESSFIFCSNRPRYATADSFDKRFPWRERVFMPRDIVLFRHSHPDAPDVYFVQFDYTGLESVTATVLPRSELQPPTERTGSRFHGLVLTVLTLMARVT